MSPLAVIFVTVFIEAFTPDARSTGTGFLIQYPNGDFVIPVLITNKHVLDGATSVAFTLVRSAGDQPMSAGVRFQLDDFGARSWVGHPDSGVDVAAMFFNPVIQGLIARDAAPFYRAFTPNQLLTREGANDLDSIEQVTFVGYPNGLFDRTSMSPIARRGHTATPIFNDYNGLPAFLIDGSVFPGSSGSPVVLLDRSYTDRNGHTYMQSRLALLGVVAAVHTRRVNGTVQMTTSGIATFDDMIDLGIVFKASAIQECVFALFESANVPLPIAVPAADNLA